MKFYFLFAGLGLSLGVATVANAQIVQDTINSTFSKVYATDVTGQKRMPEYDEACKSKHWYLLNTPFSVDYRVNTDFHSNTAFFTYANFEHTLTGALNSKKEQYVFKTEELAPALQNMHVSTLYFGLSSDFSHASAQLVFEETWVVPANCLHPNTCLRHRIIYQCVLSDM